MDLLSAASWCVAGTALGVLTGSLPGIHVNTLAAILLSAWPGLGPGGAVLLVSAGVAHSLAGALPSTYLGAPDDEVPTSVLPAHRMLREGNGPFAVRLMLDAALVGTLAGVVLILPLKWMLLEPGRLLAVLEPSLAWILASAAIWLICSERRNGWWAVGWAAAVFALAGALGLVATRLGVQAWVPVPASTLLPLLSGLFGAAGLLLGAGAPTADPQQPATRPPRPQRRRIRRSLARGVGAACLTIALPGLTSAVAASFARIGSRDQEAPSVLSTLSVIGPTHAVLSLGLLAMAGRVRTGLAAASATLWPFTPWERGAAPMALRVVLLAAIVSAVLAHVVLRRLEPRFRALVGRVPQRKLCYGTVAGMAVVVGLLSGGWGLLLFGAATVVGLVPLACNVRRVHLTGALLLPALLRLLGVL